MVLEIILTTIVIFFFIVGITTSNSDEWYGKLFHGFVVGFISFIASFMIAFIALVIINGEADRPITSSEKVYISCLSDNSEQEGALFLGCGQIDGVFKYAYYKKTDLGYKLETCNAKDVTIVYDDEDPHIEYIYNCLPKDSFWHEYVCEKELQSIIIHIPKGSIKSNYELDAK